MIEAMTFPIQFEFLGHFFYLHFLFETLAFFVGIRAYYLLKKRQKNSSISDVDRLYIMLGAMVGALVGSRVIAALETPQLLYKISILQAYQNKTIVGGLLGGLFGVEITKKIIGVKISSGDLYVLPILIAMIIGRMGCFSMGIAEPTYGIETTWFTGMDLGDGRLRHPIMLYEIAFLLLLICFFIAIKSKYLVNGARFKIFMIAYFTFRFFIEFLKPYQSLFAGFSIIQLCGIFIWVYYAVIIFSVNSRRLIIKNNGQFPAR
jgi:prolipoprotein diacylglyceryltransferase